MEMACLSQKQIALSKHKQGHANVKTVDRPRMEIRETCQVSRVIFEVVQGCQCGAGTMLKIEMAYD
jgi:hypothetical protein